MHAKSWHLIFNIFIVLTMCLFSISCEADMKITKEEVIEIANKEAIRLGYDINMMEIKVTKHTTPWNTYLKKDNNSEYALVRKEKLINKEYWAVYYAPKNMQLGGDICIFIDSSTGEVLTSLRGK